MSKNWLRVGLGLYVVLMGMILSTQGIGHALSGDVLGYVTSNEVYLMDVERQIAFDTRVSHAAAGGAVWSPDLRRLAFVDTRRNTIMLLEVESGEVRALTDNLSQALSPQWSPDGSRLAYISDTDGDLEIYVMDMSTEATQQVTDNDSPDGSPLWLPDGQRIAYFGVVDQNFALYVSDLETGTAQMITYPMAPNQLPTWSPGGQQVAYLALGSAGQEIYLADTTTNETRLLSSVNTRNFVPLRWSPDEQYLAVQVDGEIFVLDTRTGTRLDIPRGDTGVDVNPVWSPDGQRLAFASNRSGNRQIYLYDVGSGEIRNLSNNPLFNINPAWLR